MCFFDEQLKLDSAASKYQQVGTGSMTHGNPGQIGFMAGSAALAQKSASPTDCHSGGCKSSAKGR
jgi:hypothetical protein